MGKTGILSVPRRLDEVSYSDTDATMRLTIGSTPGVPTSPPRFTATTPRGVEAPAGWHLPTAFDTSHGELRRENAALLTELRELRAQMANLPQPGSGMSAARNLAETDGQQPPGPPPEGRRSSQMSDESMGVPDMRITAVTPSLPTPPVLKDMMPGGRRVLLYAYMAYMEKCESMAGSAFQPYIMPVSQYISYDMKRRVCRWFFKKQIHQVSENDWIAWVNQAFQNAVADVGRLKQSFKNDLKMDMSLPDGESRIINLMEQVSTIVEKHDHEWVYEFEPKLVVDAIVNVLRPSGLKNAVVAGLDLQYNKLYKKDVFLFGDWLLKAARSYEPFGQVAGQEGSNGSSSARGNGSSGNDGSSSSGGGGNGSKSNGGKFSSGANKPAPKTNGKGQALRADGTVRSCLKCKKPDHSVYDCPSVKDKDEAKALLKAYLNSKVAEVKAISMPLTTERPGNARLRSAASILIEGLYRVANAVVDSGSQVSVASMGLVYALRESDIHVDLVLLPTPYSINPYGASSAPIVVTHEIIFG